MSAAVQTRQLPQARATARASRHVTLLELVAAVSEATPDDREVVATVLHMLRSGSATLCGSFRNEPLESFES